VTRRYRSDIAEVLNQKRGIIVASLAIGVLIAVASIAWTRFAAQSVDALVAKRLADCKTGAKVDPIPITPQGANALWSAEHTGHGHFVPLSDLAECDPDHARTAFTQDRDLAIENANLRAAWIVAAFCIPFLWYFLLDRLREISAAILGRDRN
jgi:hypothetical protein